MINLVTQNTVSFNQLLNPVGNSFNNTYKKIKERFNETRRCPNCGIPHKEFDLGHSSTKVIVVESGTITSTLFGVCKPCADRHVK